MTSKVMRRIGKRTVTSVAAAAVLCFSSGVARGQSIDVGDAEGEAGSQVTFEVSWSAGESGASGLTVDIGFGDHPIDVANNKPACTFSDEVKAVKDSSSFSFRPPQCTVGSTCAAARAGIISFNPDNNPLPVPEGVIYSCTFTIPSEAQENDEFEFTIDLASYIVPDGTETDVTAASSGGVVRVAVPPPGTFEATETPTPTFTAAAPSSPTNTPPAVAVLAADISAADTTIPLTDASSFPISGRATIGDETITYTGKSGNSLTGAQRGEDAQPHEAGAPVEFVEVYVPTGGGGGGGGGCQIAAPAASKSAWVLFLPAAMLVWRRRRTR